MVHIELNLFILAAIYIWMHWMQQSKIAQVLPSRSDYQPH